MNRKLTIGLVVVFAVLLVYVLVIQRPKDIAADVTATPRPTVYLWTITPDQVSGFRLEDRVNGLAVAVSHEASGAWTLVEPGPQPAAAAPPCSRACRRNQPRRQRALQRKRVSACAEPTPAYEISDPLRPGILDVRTAGFHREFVARAIGARLARHGEGDVAFEN